MKSTSWLIFFSVLLPSLLSANNNAAPPRIPKLDIRFTQKGFKTVPENFVAICNSAAMTIARHYPDRKFKPILIPKANHGYPVQLDQKGPNGESMIMLAVSDGWGWAQIAFQFSHEFAHIVINQDQPRAGPNHWINEAFCEAASYHAIKVMAEEWKTHPPYRNWKSYAKHLDSYAGNYLKKENARPEGMEFIPWLRKHEKALRLGKRYPNREIYKYVSYQLYGLIGKNPKHLAAVGLLNTGLKDQALTTRQYLARWKKVLPPAHKSFADQTAAVLGFPLSSQ
ncbi:MAG: hypothetical protein CMO64_05200 [Verrucomicrobiales bacterium]|nr:hypothetical protein [Verrucomicrobiales bacterium]